MLAFAGADTSEALNTYKSYVTACASWARGRRANRGREQQQSRRRAHISSLCSHILEIDYQKLIVITCVKCRHVEMSRARIAELALPGALEHVAGSAMSTARL